MDIGCVTKFDQPPTMPASRICQQAKFCEYRDRSTAVMNIKSIEVLTLELERQYGRYSAQHGVVVVHTDAGPTGISRCLATTRGIIEHRLAPMLVGQDPLETERLWQTMYRSIGNLDADRRGTVTAIGSLDIALWDLKGKILDAPAHRLLGGYRDSIPAYADGAMFYRGPDGMAEWAARYVAEGYRAVKYHVMTEDPDEVVETVRRTRSAVGPNVQIMVDVHKRWRPRTAVHTARRMEEYDVTWLEEPVAWDDEVGGMQYLSAGTRIAVAAGESEYNLYRCRDLLQRGRIKVLQTDILTAGGFTAWLKMAGLAEAYHALVSPHGASFPELAAPLVAAVPNGMIVSAFPRGQVPEIWSRLYREPIEVRDGDIELSDRPGLGLEFDEGFLERYAA